MTENRLEPIVILLVEDNPADARLTAEGLKRAKVLNRLHVVEDGEEAIAFMRISMIVGRAMFGATGVFPDVAVGVGSLAFLMMAAGAAWTIANPGRGPHDRVAGTWVVPR